MSDKRAYFKLDVGYLTNPKIALAFMDSPTAVILHIGSIAYSAQHLTDGVVPMRLVARLAGVEESDVDVLLNHGLWVDVGGGRAEIHDYLKHQRSSVEAKGAADKARKAANARWQSTDDAQSMPASMQPGMRRASDAQMPREREEREKSYCASDDAQDDRFDEFWDVYDKKTGKQASRQKWKNALKKKGVTPDLLIDAASDYVASVKAAGKHPTFTKDPARWLNGEHWNDEVNAKPDTDPFAHLPTPAELREKRGF